MSCYIDVRMVSPYRSNSSHRLHFFHPKIMAISSAFSWPCLLIRIAQSINERERIHGRVPFGEPWHLANSTVQPTVDMSVSETHDFEGLKPTN